MQCQFCYLQLHTRHVLNAFANCDARACRALHIPTSTDVPTERCALHTLQDLVTSRTTCIVGCPDSYVISGESRHSFVGLWGGGGGGGGGRGGAGGGGGGDGGIAVVLMSDSVKLFKAARKQCLSVWFREYSDDMRWNK